MTLTADVGRTRGCPTGSASTARTSGSSSRARTRSAPRSGSRSPADGHGAGRAGHPALETVVRTTVTEQPRRHVQSVDADRRDDPAAGHGLDGRGRRRRRASARPGRARCRRSRPAPGGANVTPTGSVFISRHVRPAALALQLDCQPGTGAAGRQVVHRRDRRRRSRPCRSSAGAPVDHAARRSRSPVLTLRTTKLKRTGKRVSVALACADAPCKGTVTQVRRRDAAKRRVLARRGRAQDAQAHAVRQGRQGAARRSRCS